MNNKDEITLYSLLLVGHKIRVVTPKLHMLDDFVVGRITVFVDEKDCITKI